MISPFGPASFYGTTRAYGRDALQAEEQSVMNFVRELVARQVEANRGFVIETHWNTPSWRSSLLTPSVEAIPGCRPRQRSDHCAYGGHGSSRSTCPPLGRPPEQLLHASLDPSLPRTPTRTCRAQLSRKLWSHVPTHDHNNYAGQWSKTSRSTWASEAMQVSSGTSAQNALKGAMLLQERSILWSLGSADMQARCPRHQHPAETQRGHHRATNHRNLNLQFGRRS